MVVRCVIVCKIRYVVGILKEEMKTPRHPRWHGSALKGAEGGVAKLYDRVKRINHYFTSSVTKTRVLREWKHARFNTLAQEALTWPMQIYINQHSQCLL